MVCLALLDPFKNVTKRVHAGGSQKGSFCIRKKSLWGGEDRMLPSRHFA
jgi:hypothetical protein